MACVEAQRRVLREPVIVTAAVEERPVSATATRDMSRSAAQEPASEINPTAL
jgi:hypothetical protein